jgi:hypothetical protein
MNFKQTVQAVYNIMSSNISSDEKGDIFLDFIGRRLRLVLGFYPHFHTSAFFQKNYGESYERLEVKCDLQLKETGNLWIEHHEKRHVDSPWYESGILSPFHEWYLIGNSLEIFLFKSSWLRRNIERRTIEFRDLINHLGTSKGYLIKRENAKEVACVYAVIDPGLNEYVPQKLPATAIRGWQQFLFRRYLLKIFEAELRAFNQVLTKQ